MFADFIIPVINHQTATFDEKRNQINEMMIQMAQTVGAPPGIPETKTKLTVDRIQQTFLYLLITGITIGTLQTYFPGALSPYLEWAYSMYVYLLEKGQVTPANAANVAAEIARDPSLLSVGRFAAAAAQATLRLGNAAFIACARAAVDCAQMGIDIASHIPECAYYGLQVLGITLVTGVAKKAADTAVTAATVGIEAVTGKYNKNIADFIDADGIPRVKAAVSNTLARASDTVSTTIAGIADYSKATIIESIKDMNTINQQVTNPRPDWVEKVGVGPSINAIITNALDERIKITAEMYRTALTKLIGRLSEISFDENPAKDATNEQIQTLASDYRTSWEDPNLKAIIALWRFATTWTKLKRSESHGPLGTRKLLPTGELKIKSDSLPDDFEFRPYGDNPDEMFVEHTYKQAVGNSKNFTKQDLEIMGEGDYIKGAVLDDKFLNYYDQNTDFQHAMEDTGILSLISSEPHSFQTELIEELKITPTYIGPNNHEKNDESYRNAIIKYFEKKGKREKAEEIKKTVKKNLQNFYKKTGSSFSKGGRKSRRYKKKRSTLKRRQMKRRRTRKGKKRRHTKKR
jgi:hypothetical protein